MVYRVFGLRNLFRAEGDWSGFGFSAFRPLGFWASGLAVESSAIDPGDGHADRTFCIMQLI